MYYSVSTYVNPEYAKAPYAIDILKQDVEKEIRNKNIKMATMWSSGLYGHVDLKDAAIEIMELFNLLNILRRREEILPNILEHGENEEFLDNLKMAKDWYPV